MRRSFDWHRKKEGYEACHMMRQSRYIPSLIWAGPTTPASGLRRPLADELRLIDYYSNSQMPIQHYIGVLQNKGYMYGTDWLPHDARARTLATGRSVEEIMLAAGRKVRIVPNLSIHDGINAARTVFPRCYFDELKCAEGLQSLRHYRFDVDPDSGQFSARPLHDYHSHAADAFRYFAVAIEEDKPAVSATRH